MPPYPYMERQPFTMAGPRFRFTQVDVFSEDAFQGTGLAVIHDAHGHHGVSLDDEAMARIARWTQLSETAFLFPPTHPSADYRVRIFTPEGELPFAGHPTLGSARAWLAWGGDPKHPGFVVQECGVGLVKIRVGDGTGKTRTNLHETPLAFAAPPMTRSGNVDPDTLRQAVEGCGLTMNDVVASNWVANGPNWLGILVRDAEAVLVRAHKRTDDMEVGIIGPYESDGPADYEVRAFCADVPGGEDPVTGSLNASLAQWLMGAGLAQDRYAVQQGTALGRRGRVMLAKDGDDVWVGGAAVIRITGSMFYDEPGLTRHEVELTTDEATPALTTQQDVYFP